MACILITGSNRGIGAALAARAGDRGHDVLRASPAGQGGGVIFGIIEAQLSFWVIGIWAMTTKAAIRKDGFDVKVIVQLSRKLSQFVFYS